MIARGSNLHYGLVFCQLALEKSLKALVVKVTGQHPVKSHDLELLSKKAMLNLPGEDLDFLNEMTAFNIEARYPDEKFEIYKKATPELTNELLEKTVRFSVWIQELVER